MKCQQYRQLLMCVIPALLFSGVVMSSPRSAVIGQTFDIAEPDALEEIYQRVEKVDWKKALHKPFDELSAYQPTPLPYAEKDLTRNHIPWYTTPFDLKDQHGRIVYPQGFRFNPLEYLHMPTRLVVFADTQVALIEPHLKDQDMLILSAGDVRKVTTTLQRPVFILDQSLIERLGLRVVPSIVQQSGTTLEINELEHTL